MAHVGKEIALGLAGSFRLFCKLVCLGNREGQSLVGLKDFLLIPIFFGNIAT